MSMRIDKWLWHARFFKTRALAQNAAASGLLRLNGTRVEKASCSVKAGDILTVARGREVLLIRVLGDSIRRGPASEAKTLYEIVENEALEHEAQGP